VEVDVAGGLALFLRQAVEVGDALADGLGLLVGVFFLDVEHKGTGIKGQPLYMLQLLYAWRKPCTDTCVVWQMAQTVSASRLR